MEEAMRASDADREHVAEVLRERAGEGYLSIETLSRRLDGAYAARDAGDLASLVADLPVRVGRVHSTIHRLAAAARQTLREAAPREGGAVERLAPDPAAVGRLGRGRFTLGRAPGRERRLENPSVSRHHAELRFADGRWVLLDLRSTNSLHVNGRRVWRVVIEAGDEPQLGDQRVLFEPLPEEG